MHACLLIPDRVSRSTPDALSSGACSGDQVAWEAIVRQHWRQGLQRRVQVRRQARRGRGSDAGHLPEDLQVARTRSTGARTSRPGSSASAATSASITTAACARSGETIDRDVDANDLTPASREPGPIAALEQQRSRRAAAPGARSAAGDAADGGACCATSRSSRTRRSPTGCDLPEGTVKSRINRGRTELARQIKRLQRADDCSPHAARPAQAGRRTGA